MIINNKIKIYFIRHSKLDLPYKNHLEMPYEVLDDLATSRLDSSITKDSEQLFLESASALPLRDIDVIHFNNSSSQSKRSKESAFLIGKILKEKYNKSVSILGNPDLKEIDFSLKEILLKEDFLKQGMPAVRTALYHAIINQGSVEQIGQIYQRIESIFQNLKKYQEKNQTVLLVSHDFFMRTIEIYLQKTKDQNMVTIDDLEKTTLNTYFKGFGVSYDLKYFQRF